VPGADGNGVTPARDAPARVAPVRDAPVRIAMWSGPRNLSTALMRAWENRPDTVVSDEPFYAHYLFETGLEHRGRDAIVAAQPADWRDVVAGLAAPLPAGVHVHYQKHMSHHLLPGVGRNWLDDVVNCFLIRDPAEVLLSYARARSDPTLEDLGLVQQVEIFEHVRGRTGRAPPVLDATDLLSNPERMLGLLCAAVGVEFHPSMLAWPAGRRHSDGVWAEHWYATVEASTGFKPHVPRSQPVPAAYAPLLEAGMPGYTRLHAQRLG
jgi:hypothetical protein